MPVGWSKGFDLPNSATPETRWSLPPLTMRQASMS